MNVSLAGCLLSVTGNVWSAKGSLSVTPCRARCIRCLHLFEHVLASVRTGTNSPPHDGQGISLRFAWRLAFAASARARSLASRRSLDSRLTWRRSSLCVSAYWRYQSVSSGGKASSKLSIITHCYSFRRRYLCRQFAKAARAQRTAHKSAPDGSTVTLESRAIMTLQGRQFRRANPRQFRHLCGLRRSGMPGHQRLFNQHHAHRGEGSWIRASSDSGVGARSRHRVAIELVV